MSLSGLGKISCFCCCYRNRSWSYSCYIENYSRVFRVFKGLDFEFVLMRALRPDLQRCITDGRDKILEAIKHRASEDVWKPQKVC